MSMSVMWGLILIGAGAVTAGLLGLALPDRDRLAAAFPLVIGAGIGVVALAIGTYNSASPDDAETAFVIASAFGFAAVILSSALLWSRHRNERPTRAPADETAP